MAGTGQSSSALPLRRISFLPFRLSGGGLYQEKSIPDIVVYVPERRAPLSWYSKFGLDFTDPNVDREDPDNDGFSNIVEFKNDPVGVRQKASDCDGSKSTNPLDAKDHPSYLARLRLQKYELRAFHIQFKGYQQLNGVNESSNSIFG